MIRFFTKVCKLFAVFIACAVLISSCKSQYYDASAPKTPSKRYKSNYTKKIRSHSVPIGKNYIIKNKTEYKTGKPPSYKK
jgi:hypothetical protein